MTNVYGYNRKTREEDEAILAAVQRHHDAVAAQGYLVVMTSLVGSQNYDLDHKDSDIDTFSLIYPTLGDLALAKEPYAGMFEYKDGHCEVKDIRLALNLLRKTSPNSVEYFTSKYKVYNSAFAPILKDYLDDNTKLWNMIHCNYQHMLYAMAGMAHQLTKRNMPAGKRFAHALRLDDMLYHYDESYNRECEQIAGRLDEYRDNLILDKQMKQTEQFGLALIDSFQWKLFKQYLMETNKNED